MIGEPISAAELSRRAALKNLQKEMQRLWTRIESYEFVVGGMLVGHKALAEKLPALWAEFEAMEQQEAVLLALGRGTAIETDSEDRSDG